MNQSILYIYAAFEPFQLFIIAFGDDLDSAVFQVFYPTLQAECLCHIRYSSSVADLLNLTGDIGNQALHMLCF